MIKSTPTFRSPMCARARQIMSLRPGIRWWNCTRQRCTGKAIRCYHAIRILNDLPPQPIDPSKTEPDENTYLALDHNPG